MQFETVVGDDKAVMTYRWLHGDWLLCILMFQKEAGAKVIQMHWRNMQLRLHAGKNIKLKVYCVFMQGYMKRHPENNDLISTQ